MKTKNEEFEVLVPNCDGSAVAETVKVSVPLRWDEEINEWLLTPEAHQIIEETKARHMGLLLPAQMKELRERYNYSQKEMGELFQVGEKSWTRWESGKHRPSRSINLLIRALYEGEISLHYLLQRAGKPQPEKQWAATDVAAFSNWMVWASAAQVLWEQPGITSSIAVEYHKPGSGKSKFLKQIMARHSAPANQTAWPGSQKTGQRARHQPRFDTDLIGCPSPIVS